MPEADAEGGLVFWGVGPPTNECPGCSVLLEPIGSYTRYMSRLQKVLSRSPPQSGRRPRAPCPTLPLPPAKKKERPACLQAGRRRQGARGGSMPAVLGGGGPRPRGALAGPRGGGVVEG